ncbi:MAG: carboxypeptidase-like regulatory domain-containing protein, partial [Cyclobacterium sp.]
MKINLLRLIVFYSKRTLKYFLLQMLLIQAIMAEPSSSQGLEDYQVTLRANNQKLVRVLSHLEKQTDFMFAYNQEVARDDSRVTLDMTADLKTILQKLTEQVDFDFKRVNENIFVTRHKGIETNALTDYLSNNELPEEEWVEISGTVVDENGQPIPGATILVEGTNKGTVTDIDGNFSIDADEGEVILVSFIGYQSQRITVANQTNLDIALQEDQSSLEEVVVVGYGTQRKSDLTGAISSVTSKDLKETPAGNFLEQSQGRLAGVDIVRANGSPGSPVQIRIRGNRSINASNDPLYVIDGIPTSANISDFNPNDIES